MGDDDPADISLAFPDDFPEQVMSEGAFMFEPFDLWKDRIGLEGPDPDRKCQLFQGVCQKDHWLLICRIDNELVDLYLKEFLLFDTGRLELLGHCISR